jgi:hypothetical protein
LRLGIRALGSGVSPYKRFSKRVISLRRHAFSEAYSHHGEAGGNDFLDPTEGDLPWKPFRDQVLIAALLQAF